MIRLATAQRVASQRILLVAGTTTLALLLVMSTPPARAEIKWPIRLVYSASHLEYAVDVSGSSEQRYEFLGANWQEWTNRPLDGRAATCWQRRSDGLLYEGARDCMQMKAANVKPSSVGGAPNAWLNGRSVEGYISLGYEQVPLETGKDVAARLKIAEEDLVELQVAKDMACDELGYLDCTERASEKRPFRATVVIHRSTALPLLNEEVLGDLVLSRYVVDSLEPLESYKPPGS